MQVNKKIRVINKENLKKLEDIINISDGYINGRKYSTDPNYKKEVDKILTDHSIEIEVPVDKADYMHQVYASCYALDFYLTKD